MIGQITEEEHEYLAQVFGKVTKDIEIAYLLGKAHAINWTLEELKDAIIFKRQAS